MGVCRALNLMLGVAVVPGGADRRLAAGAAAAPLYLRGNDPQPWRSPWRPPRRDRSLIFLMPRAGAGRSSPPAHGIGQCRRSCWLALAGGSCRLRRARRHPDGTRSDTPSNAASCRSCPRRRDWSRTYAGPWLRRRDPGDRAGRRMAGADVCRDVKRRELSTSTSSFQTLN